MRNTRAHPAEIIGSRSKVELDPPATVSCDLAKALAEWIDAVQREAKKLLGSAVVKLHASSYACRNIYNRANPPLSQHAVANALDVSEFVLATGEHVTVRRRIGATDLSTVKTRFAWQAL